MNLFRVDLDVLETEARNRYVRALLDLGAAEEVLRQVGEEKFLAKMREVGIAGFYEADKWFLMKFSDGDLKTRIHDGRHCVSQVGEECFFSVVHIGSNGKEHKWPRCYKMSEYLDHIYPLGGIPSEEA